MKNKLYLENEVAEEILGKVKLFTGEANSVVEFTFGTNVSGNVLLNVCNILSGSQMVQTVFQTATPEGYAPEYASHVVTTPDGKEEEKKILKPYKTVAVKVKDFMATVGNLISLKEKIYFSFGEGTCIVGVSDVKLQLPVLAADSVPKKLVFNKSGMLLQMGIGVNQFIDAMRIGSCMAHNEAEESRGLGNVVIATFLGEPQGGLIPAKVKAYSTNGNAISRGECNVTVPENKEMLARLEEAIKKGGKDFFLTAFPKKAVKNILGLLYGQQEAQVWISDKHVCVIIGKSTMYTFAQGAKPCAVVFMADQWQQQEKAFDIVVDTEALKAKVDLLNKISAYNSSDKLPIRLTAKPEWDNLLIEIAGKSEVGIVKVPIVGKKLTENLVVYFSGAKLAEVIGSLKKGNLVFSCTAAGEVALPVQFANGDLTELGTSVAYLLPVRSNESAQEEAPKKEAETVEEE